MMMSAYRHFQKFCIRPAVLPRFFKIRGTTLSKLPILTGRRFLRALPAPEAKNIWLHAASVGELESLQPVIEKLGGSSSLRLCTSIMSDSAHDSLLQLKQEVTAKGTELSVGYSPWEGEWQSALEAFGAKIFVTVRYEAWPDLWWSLAKLKIPLVIVGAQKRSSLVWMKRIFQWLGQELPALHLMVFDPYEIPALKQLFPKARIYHIPDPRWERALTRAEHPSQKAREVLAVLKAHAHSLIRPWGILGSVWPECVHLWKDVFANVKNSSGTVILVPHRIDSESLNAVSAALKTHGIEPVLLSELKKRESIAKEKIPVLMINEMGVLAELYSEAGWAYVGGGLGHGVHSTIEPAIYGLPICIGPRKARLFSEIRSLEENSQLQFVFSSQDALKWWQDLSSPSRQVRDTWRTQAASRRGASDQISRLILSLLESPRS